MEARLPTFGPEVLAGVDEPVRRFLGHAIREGAPIGHPLRLAMEGRITAPAARRGGCSAGRGSSACVPCGGDVLAEARFGDLVLPSGLRVGWWFGTTRFRPFFEADIREAVPA